MVDIVPSEELRSFMQRFCYAALEAWDFDSMKEMISARAHSVIIGADPAEWWTAREGLDVLMVQARELGRINARSTQLVANSYGNVGWLADQLLITYESGLTIPMRITGVVAIERGHWRFVQIHASFAQANEQSLGRTLTTRIENIEQDVRVERPDVSQGSVKLPRVLVKWVDEQPSLALPWLPVSA